MFSHYTVLKQELATSVLHKDEGVYIDGTLGGGGHTKYLLEHTRKTNVIGIDRDITAINNIPKNYMEKRLKLYHGNYSEILVVLKKFNIDFIAGIMLDLGFSSPQVDSAERGFSYMHDGPLDMRMDKRQKKDAKYIVNFYSKEELQEIFQKYGEEKNAWKIAENIVLKRREKEIRTTFELVSIIDLSIPYKLKSKGHDAKKVFQALRIEVNNELEDLELCLDRVYDKLEMGGRIGVITFHSLEDKLVKYKFKRWSEIPKELNGLPEIPKQYLPKMRLVTNKSIKPSPKELKENSRSKSANLRVIERIR